MKRKPEALVILSPAFPANEADENWIPTHQLMVNALKKNFPAVNIFVLSFLYPEHQQTYDWKGVRVTSFNGMRQRKWKRIFLWWNIWQELRSIRREYHIKGLFSFWCGETALIGKYFGKFYSIRHCCWISGQDAQKKNKWVKWINPRPQELAAMSNFLARTFFKNHGIRPEYVLPNAVDPQLFPPVTSQEKDIDILGAGALIPLKRYHILVEVVASLRSEFPAVKALHCGGGDEKESLQQLIKEVGLEHNLSLLGERPRQDVLRLMQRAKVFLHTSSYEGFSTVCLEALYAGAHVISFCDPLDQRVAQWHIVQSTEEMVKKASEILQNPDTEYKPVLLYTMDTIAKSAMKLFDYA